MRFMPQDRRRLRDEGAHLCPRNERQITCGSSGDSFDRSALFIFEKDRYSLVGFREFLRN